MLTFNFELTSLLLVHPNRFIQDHLNKNTQQLWSLCFLFKAFLFQTRIYCYSINVNLNSSLKSNSRVRCETIHRPPSSSARRLAWLSFHILVGFPGRVERLESWRGSLGSVRQEVIELKSWNKVILHLKVKYIGTHICFIRKHYYEYSCTTNQDWRHIICGRPSILQNIEAYRPICVHIRMEHFRRKPHHGRFIWIFLLIAVYQCLYKIILYL